MAKILIVEDDASLYAIYSAELKLRGYEVYHCADGMQAMSMIRDITPDLILLDIILPGRNGLEILDELMNTDEFAEQKVIVVTNYGNSENVKRALELGAIDYVLKYNIVPSELSAKVADVLGDAGASSADSSDEVSA